MNKRYTARDLQLAFVEGAKAEYERLAKRWEASRNSGQSIADYRRLYRGSQLEFLYEPFAETYNQRKDARYEAAAVAFPMPQRPKVLTYNGLDYRFVNGRVQVKNPSQGEDGWFDSAANYCNGEGALLTNSPGRLRVIADLREHPTEDVA